MSKDVHVLEIVPAFRDAVPPLSPDERDQLEKDIMAHGCLSPVIVWDGAVLDGHNRYEICHANGIPFEISDMEFDTQDDALAWVIGNQLARRNLSDFQRTEISLRLKQLYESAAARNQTGGVPVSDSIHVRAKLANVAGVSTETHRKVERVIESGIPKLVGLARDGQVSVDAAYHVSQLPPDEQATVSDSPRAVTEKAKKLRVAKTALTTETVFDSCNQAIAKYLSGGGATLVATTMSQEDRLANLARAEAVLSGIFEIAFELALKAVQHDPETGGAISTIIQKLGDYQIEFRSLTVNPDDNESEM